MRIPRTSTRWTTLAAACACAISAAHASDISPYVTAQRWLQAAEDAANARVTYEVCGWGSIDLLTPLLTGALRRGVDPVMLDALATRYDDSVRERRRNEAVLTAHGANAPMQRVTGLHATGGCADSVRARIERLAIAEETR